MHRKAQILLTGWRGFIGSHTLKLLRERGYRIGNFSGDVRRVRDWERNLFGGEVVLHLAGVRSESDKDFSVNTKGMENLFLAAEKIGKLPSRVVYGSTQAVYMGCKPPFIERMKPKPTAVYGKSKLEAERVLLRQGKKLGISVVVLRYSTVLGPGIRKESGMSGPLALWVEAGLSGRPIKVFQDGKQTRDYIHVEDVARANLLAVRELPEGIYNVGGGREMKLIDLAVLVQKATKRKSKINIVGGEASRIDPRRLASDVGKLERYGWKPGHSIKEAVEECVRENVDMILD